MRASVALPSSADATATVAAWLSRAAAFAERRRWWIVGACIAAQWAFVAREAIFRIHHNGWIYQHGDDGPWYWTTAWTLKSLHVPITGVGPGWPYLLTPLAWIFGPNMADGLPALITLNVVVLTPAAIIGMYLLGERLAGRLFGVWSACAWVVLPILALALYTPRNRPILVESFLPTATGLNALADFPSMVFAIYAAYLALRALDTNAARDGLLAGMTLGFLVLLKPANGPLPLAACTVLALGFRHRALLATLGAMLPALVALTLWKNTGFGYVPLLSLGATREAAGAAPELASIHSYVNLNWHHLNQNAHVLGQVFWSLRLLEFLFVAGSFGLIRRAGAKGLMVVLWFAGFVLVKASVPYAGVYDTSVYRFLLPAWPAWILIVAGVVFCWPGGRTWRSSVRAADGEAVRSLRPPHLAVMWAVTVSLALGPLVVAAVASPIPRDSVAQDYAAGNFAGSPVPVVDFGLQAERTGASSVRLRWVDHATARARTSYQIFKSRNTGCRHLDRAAPVCFRDMQLIGSARTTEFNDPQATGRFTYRVALASGTRIDPDNPPLLLLSNPVTITAP